MVSLTWESLGLLVFRREVTLDLAGDFLAAQLLPHGESCPAISQTYAEMLNETPILNGLNGSRNE
jgi:hypothetical protein